MQKYMYWAIMAVLATLYACGGNANNSQPAQRKTLSGAEVFQQRCVICHGADGKLGLNGAKPLPNSTLSLEERIGVVHNGRNVMPAFKDQLSEEEIKAVAAYTLQLGK